MIYTITLAIAVLVAVLRGGRVAAIGSVQLRLGWLILAAFGLQVAIVYLPALQAGGRYELPAALMVLTYSMLLAAVIANRHLSGMKLVGLGLFLNLVVMVANGGFMPITPTAATEMGLMPQGLDWEPGMRVARSKDVLLKADDTVLWLLSDIFVPGRYIPISTVFSIGDAVGAVGLFLAIQRAMLPGRWNGEKRPSSRAASGVS